MRRTDRYFLASCDFLHAREKEDLFPIAGMIFVVLEMRDLKMSFWRNCHYLYHGEEENLGILFPVKMLV